MVVIQTLWTHWTRASRDAAAARPRLTGPLPLLTPVGPPPPGQAWVHDIHRREDEAFALRTWSGWASQDDLERMWFTHIVTWKLRSGGAVEVGLRPPSPGMRQSHWPAALPSPLFLLEPGDTGRISWNGRFRKTMGGSNRGSFYEEHLIFVAATEAPEPDLFTRGPTTRTADLMTRIY